MCVKIVRLALPKPTVNTGAPAVLAAAIAWSMVRPPMVSSPSVISTMALRPLRAPIAGEAVWMARYSAVLLPPVMASMAVFSLLLSLVKSWFSETLVSKVYTAAWSELPNCVTNCLAALFSFARSLLESEPLVSIRMASETAPLVDPDPTGTTVMLRVAPDSLRVKLLVVSPVTGLPVESVTLTITLLLGQDVSITWLIVRFNPLLEVDPGGPRNCAGVSAEFEIRNSSNNPVNGTEPRPLKVQPVLFGRFGLESVTGWPRCTPLA